MPKQESSTTKQTITTYSTLAYSTPYNTPGEAFYYTYYIDSIANEVGSSTHRT
jgi:hypothetical protein